jgi:RimJ/RimL family protein N-acetyltransferase
LQNIGDKGVRSIADARGYLLDGPLASYERYGFGLYLVERKESRAALGICGLLQRETLDDADIGFAFLPEFWGQGYAEEAARAVKAYAYERLGLARIVAITLPSNRGSIRVLETLGMRFEKTIRLAEEAEELMLFEYEFAALGERA